MRNLSPSKKVLFMPKSFLRLSKARYLVKKIKTYKEVAAVRGDPRTWCLMVRVGKILMRIGLHFWGN